MNCIYSNIQKFCLACDIDFHDWFLETHDREYNQTFYNEEGKPEYALPFSRYVVDELLYKVLFLCTKNDVFTHVFSYHDNNNLYDYNNKTL